MSEIVSALEDAYQALVNFFSGLGQGIESTASSVISPVSSFFSTVGNAIVSVGAFIYAALRRLADDFYNAFAALGGYIREGLSDIYKGIRELGDILESLLVKLWHLLADAARALYRALRGLLSWLARTLVEAGHEVMASLDNFLYGLWCNVRSKLADIVMANITEAGIYGLIETAYKGGIKLDGSILKQLVKLGVGVMAMPAVGMLAGLVLDSVLPGCATPTRSVFGSMNLVPTSVLSLLPSEEELLSPTLTYVGPGALSYSGLYPLPYSLTVSGPTPLWTQVPVAYVYSLPYTIQFFPGRVRVVTLTVAGVAGLGSALAYSLYYGLPLSPGLASLTASLTASVITSARASGASGLASSITYSLYFGTPVSASALLRASVAAGVILSGLASGSSRLTSSITYTVVVKGSSSGSASLSAIVTSATTAPSYVSASVEPSLSLTYSVGALASTSGSASLTVSSSISRAAPASASASAEPKTSLTYSLGAVSSMSAQSALKSLTAYSVSAPASASASVRSAASLTYSVGGLSSASAGSSLSASTSYTVRPPPVVETLVARTSVTASGEIVDPTTWIASIPTPEALTALYNMGAQQAADVLMSLVARGSPSPAYSLLQSLASQYGANYAQSVLHAAAASLYFSPLIVLMTFNRSSVSWTSNGSQSGALFASSVNGGGYTQTWALPPGLIVTQSISDATLVAYQNGSWGPYGNPGQGQVPGGAAGTHLVVFSLSASSVTLNVSGQAGSPGINSTSSANGSPYTTTCPSAPVTPYAGFMLLAPGLTPGISGKAGCCGAPPQIYNGGGGGGTVNCDYGYGGWFLTSSNSCCCSCLTPTSITSTPCSMEVMYFSSIQDMIVYLMEAAVDLWMEHVLGYTPASPVPWPLMAGTGGGGSAGYGAGAGGGGGGEGITVCYSCTSVSINASGGAGGNAYSTSLDGGAGAGGGGGIALIAYSYSNVSPSLTATPGPYGSNTSSSCSATPWLGSPGSTLSYQLVWATPPYVSSYTVSW